MPINTGKRLEDAKIKLPFSPPPSRLQRSICSRGAEFPYGLALAPFVQLTTFSLRWHRSLGEHEEFAGRRYIFQDTWEPFSG